ncbi:MAG: alpha-ketoglutarate-dependent dioxygenase AlkB [Polyangiaceae bacterium]|nr:alpha-ketoglutarate-dependent dioxygenase AlkB [Polyangiaceae bacterium]
MERRLNQACWLQYEPNWLSPEAAALAFEQLRTGLSWEQKDIVMFGKHVRQPRLIAWAGALPYRYSHQTLPPREFTAPLTELLSAVNHFTRCDFNHLLLNRYRDENDSMGFHADNEPELGPDPIVATLSLGGERLFKLIPVQKSLGQTASMLLHAGSLLVMRGACQREFRHGIPKSSRPTQERISVTFRTLLRAP